MKLVAIPLALALAGLMHTHGAFAQTTVNFTINQPAAPVAAYTYTNQNLTYAFTNQSTGSGLSYSWDFGDGSSSTLEDPGHTFPQEGPYVVCLTITDANMCTSTTCNTILSVGLPGQMKGLTLDIAPNPFNGSTLLRYTLPQAGHLDVRIYDLSGALVQTLQQGPKDAGTHSLTIGAGLAAGAYLVRLDLDGHQVARRIMKAD